MPSRQIVYGGSPRIERPRQRTSPPSARSWPLTMLKNVDLPAPLGPISARISPRDSANDTSSTARTPPNARRTRCTSRTDADSVMRTRPDHAEKAAREHQDDQHEDRAEHELPVLRVARDERIEQLVEGGAERRAGRRLDATEQHHHERL